MTSINHYLDDGANQQARAVLAMVKLHLGDGIEESWDAKWGTYRADVKVSRFDNCREQGYFVYLRSADYNEQITLAFAEYRSSDSIVVYKLEGTTFNAPTNDLFNRPENGLNGRFFGFGKITEAAEFIAEELVGFWKRTSLPQPAGEETADV